MSFGTLSGQYSTAAGISWLFAPNTNSFRVKTLSGKLSTSGTIKGVSLGESNQKTTRTPITRAVRAAMVETAEYLDCVLYLKDECIEEYKAKDEARKRKNDSLDNIFGYLKVF